jgi:glutamate dehydrogenase
MSAQPATSVKRLDQAVVEASRALGKAKAEEAGALVRRYFARTPPEDVAARSPALLARIVVGHWRFAARRKPGVAAIRVFNPNQDEHGWDGAGAVVEIVTDDMPFLVDSVASELVRLGHIIDLMVHPIFRLRRDGQGRCQGLVADGATVAGAIGESFMHVELERRVDAEQAKTIAARLAKVLGDVAVAVKDWRAMVARVEETVTQIDTTPPPLDAAEIAESKAFLRWIADNHFTLLGCRDYDYKRAAGKEALVPVGNSGLGVMRDPDFRILNVAGMATDMSPMVRDFLKLPRLLIITKANVRSTVHRSIYMDYIGVKRFDMAGRVIGERRFVGLFTSAAYNRSPREIPLLRRKMALTLERAGFAPNSHDGKALVNIIETYPRDELFQTGEDDLHATSIGILHLQERPRVRLFVRQDKFERYVSALVFVPRERYDTALRNRFEAILAQAWKGRNSAFYVHMGDGALIRLHFIVGTTPGSVPSPDLGQIETALAEAARTWDERLAQALIQRFGADEGTSVARRLAGAFPAAYRETFGAAEAIHDYSLFQSLAAHDQVALDLYRLPGDVASTLRFKIHHPGGAIPLSDCLPIFENLGLKALDEVPYRIGAVDKAVWIQDFHLAEPDGRPVDLAALKAKFEGAFYAVWHDDAENDALNKLVLRAGLAWRQVVVLRLLARYLRQAGITFSNAYMEQTLTSNAKVARLLVELFEARFDPKAQGAKAAQRIAELRKTIDAALEAVSVADEDRILRRFRNLIEAALRTNFYQPGADGKPKSYISVKFDSRKIDELPLPRPMVEVFVYAVRVEAIHLRGGKVARGGIRWSDRREDFRTEILGLIKAQMVKNAVIVPVGAKGGFYCKRMPVGAPPDAVQKEGIECYRTLIRGLLDITDNMKGEKVLSPKDVVRHDEDDPYLVVAADKGTATFSDIANALSRDYGFWLDDAFASGGSAGYDHKKMGITARGAWVAVQRHFREIGVDADTAPIAVAGIGDMGGDVFGNGLLRSSKMKLVAAFNHAHIFLDPAPDPAKSFAERKRLFQLPRSSWADYDAKLISKGGGVFERKAKSIALSAEAKALLGTTKDQLAPLEIIRLILTMPVDLLWNGGIGTYVKASSESNAQVGDRANDALRIDGKDLKCKVVGEGGNLGFTQRGRVEYALAGGRINTDAIDNSAGVDCSDHEVNIKILTGAIGADGKLPRKARDKLLAKMTDEVGDLVLRDNYLQTQAISMAEAQATQLAEVQARFMRRLERAGRLDRNVEMLPDDETVAERLKGGKGLTRPEIAVLLAYAKMTLYEDLLETDVPEDPYLTVDLHRYFPRPLRKGYARWIERHRLRREIAGTDVVNSMVNRVGPTFVDQIVEEGGFKIAEIMRAYPVVRDAYALRPLFGEIEALDNKVPAAAQTKAMIDIAALVRHGTLWMLRNAPRPIAIARAVEAYAPGIAKLAAALPGILGEGEAKAFRERVAALQKQGVPEATARRIAALAPLGAALDIVTVATQKKRPVEDVGRAYFAVGERLGMDWLRGAAERLSPQTHWERQAIAAVVDDLYGAQRALAGEVLANGKSSDQALARWMGAHAASIERARLLVGEFRNAGDIDVAKLAIANRSIRALTT